MTARTCLVAAALGLAACRSERQASAADTPPSEQTVGGVGTAVATKQSFPQLVRSEEHTSELQSRLHLVCRLLLEKKKNRRANAEPSVDSVPANHNARLQSSEFVLTILSHSLNAQSKTHYLTSPVQTMHASQCFA